MVSEIAQVSRIFLYHFFKALNYWLFLFICNPSVFAPVLYCFLSALNFFGKKKSCNINPFVPQPMSYLWRVKKIQNPAFQSQKMILILQLIAPTHFSGRNRLEFAFSKFKGYFPRLVQPIYQMTKVYIAITYRVTTVISFLECCIARQVTPAKLGWQYTKLPNSG